MPGILISYRRADAGGWAGRLFDSLKANLGRVRVFLDIDAIPPGAKFDEYIAEAVGSCEVLIALIGPRWLTPSDSGKRRLDDPNDFIRMEIATALARPKVTVIPVLVGKANMPNADELPDDIKPLARRQYYELSDSRWADDCRNLAKALTPIVYRRRRRVGAMIFAVFASVGLSFIFLLKFFAETCTSPPRTGPAPSARPSARGS